MGLIDTPSQRGQTLATGEGGRPKQTLPDAGRNPCAPETTDPHPEASPSSNS